MRKLLLALVLMPLMTLADTEEIEGVTWSYTVADGNATVEGANPSSGALIIPSTLGSCPVTSIGDFAFYACSGLTSVTIPSSVTSIGAEAFLDCSGLTSVTIPSGVTSIGDFAFYACSGLTSVTIPSSVTSIGAEAFLDCSGLTSVTIPSSVTSIGSSAFSDCSGLTSVTISEGATTIGGGEFRRCVGLTSVTIPSSVTSIGAEAFYACSGLTSVTISKGVKGIDVKAFRDCRSISSVTLPANFKVEDVFPDSKEVITDVTILGDGSALCDYAYLDCRLLENVTFDGTFTEIGESAFENCRHIETIYIPDGVTEIGRYAFAGCSGLISIMIPKSVTSVGRHAFDDCEDLETIIVGVGDTERVKAVLEAGHVDTDYFTFAEVCVISFDANGDTPVPADIICGKGARYGELPTVTREGYSFDGWFTALEGGTKVDSTTIASGDATLFAHWTYVQPVPADGEYVGEYQGVSYRFRVWNGAATIVGSEVPLFGTVALPSEYLGCSVVGVGSGAFRQCEGLVSVEIPDTVMEIGSEAFQGCVGLKSAMIPDSVKVVGTRAFQNCDGLDSVRIPASVTSIGKDAFDCPAYWTTHYKDALAEKVGSGPVAGNSVTVSNVVVHYILNSVQPEFAIQPADDMNFVNIITEVKGSAAVAIPETWAASYSGFKEKFGTDFTQALLKPTGKIGMDGTPMLVWQDYVAGTDPTNEKDVFTASITIVDGKVTISYTPELDDARKTMRKYTTWGKTSLMDTDWTEVQDGHEAEYNFFKVSVEMR